MRPVPNPDPTKPRLLLDECVPQLIFQALQNLRFDTKWIGKECPSASDREVVELAVRENRVLVSLDKDFGAILMIEQPEIPGLVLFRIKVIELEKLKTIIIDFLERYGSRLAGSLTVYKEGRIRQRPLKL